jgi:acetyl esterase/lipase
MLLVWTYRARRARAIAAGLAIALATLEMGTAAADPHPYVPSEVVPTGTTPPPVKSGYAGDRTNAPHIRSQSYTFGQIASRSGIGLRTYRYSTTHENASTLDVYTPRQFVGRHNRNVRTVILVHGGAWQMGDRIDLEPKAVQLAKRGLVVISVNYRLATEAQWPAQRDDVNAAIKFIRGNARKLNVDTKRVVLLGSSAGGQIAANVATMGAGKKRFRGLVTLSGLVNPLLMATKDPSYSNSVVPEMLLRCLPAECPDRYASATALNALDAKDMPSLLFHSRFEVPWDPTQARQFARTSRALGVPSKLVVLPGELHGIDAWKELWPTLKTWLLERLGTTDRVVR